MLNTNENGGTVNLKTNWIKWSSYMHRPKSTAVVDDWEALYWYNSLNLCKIFDGKELDQKAINQLYKLKL